MVGSGAEVLVKVNGLFECFRRDFSFSMEIVRSRKLTFLDGSSNSHSKMPKLLVSFLKSSQLCSSGLPIHMPQWISETATVCVKFWNERQHFVDCKIYSSPHAGGRCAHSCAKQLEEVGVSSFKYVVAHDYFHDTFYSGQRESFWKRYRV